MKMPATAIQDRRLPTANILLLARATTTNASSRWGEGPRGTPTVDGDRVYAMSGKGDLSCINIADGKVVW
jgi:hypothetical protein